MNWKIGIFLMRMEMECRVVNGWVKRLMNRLVKVRLCKRSFEGGWSRDIFCKESIIKMFLKFVVKNNIIFR